MANANGWVDAVDGSGFVANNNGHDALESAGFDFMAGGSGRPGIWVKRVKRGPVIVVRVDANGYSATSYPRESYPDGGTEITGGMTDPDALVIALGRAGLLAGVDLTASEFSDRVRFAFGWAGRETDLPAAVQPA